MQLSMLNEYFELGSKDAYWYDGILDQTISIVGNRQNAVLFLGLFAATSPMGNLKHNMLLAVKAWRIYSRPDYNASDFERAFKFKSHRLNILRVLAGIKMHGEKVNSFYSNLLGLDRHKVTVDRWILRAVNGKLENMRAPTPGEYRRVSEVIISMSKERSMYPMQVQAAIWAGIKIKHDDPWNTIEPFEPLLRRHWERRQLELEF